MQVIHSMPAILRTIAVLGATAFVLAACATPTERVAVSDIKRKQAAIPYNEDVKTSANRSIFGFRSLPKRAEAAAVTERLAKPAAEVSQCLQAKLQSQFKLPADFYQVKNYANNAQTIVLVNPFTKSEGLLMDVTERGVGSSEVSLYANGTTLSRAWRRLPAACR